MPVEHTVDMTVNKITDAINAVYRKLAGEITRLNRRLIKKFGRQQLNNIVGLAVLIIGSAAFLGVILLAFNRQFSDEAISSRIYSGTAKIEEIEGNWKTSLDNGRATLQAKDGYYQLIFSRGGSKIRRYSRGTVEAQNNYLIFRPRNDLGRPENSEYATYYGWPMTAFAIEAARRGKKLVWKQGPLEYSLPESVLEGPGRKNLDAMIKNFNVSNPVFKLTDEEFIFWDPLE